MSKTFCGLGTSDWVPKWTHYLPIPGNAGFVLMTAPSGLEGVCNLVVDFQRLDVASATEGRFEDPHCARYQIFALRTLATGKIAFVALPKDLDAHFTVIIDGQTLEIATEAAPGQFMVFGPKDVCVGVVEGIPIRAHPKGLLEAILAKPPATLSELLHAMDSFVVLG